MSKLFDDMFTQYLACLARLDTVEDISEKNMLFRQLAEQLSELERCIAHRDRCPADPRKEGG